MMNKGIDRPSAIFQVRSRLCASTIILGLVVCVDSTLIGCATSPDPHQGGFVDGIVGMAGGGYDRRIKDREHAYQVELTAQDQLRAQAQELERERAAVRSELDQASRRMRALEARIQHERRLLAAQRSEVARANRAKLEQAEQKLGHVKTALSKVDVGAQSIDASKNNVRSLESQLNEINALVEISGAGL